MKNNDENFHEEALDHLDVLKKFRVVMRAAQRHSAWIDKQCGVNGAQLWVMQELSETPNMRVGEIANRLAIHQTTTSNLIEILNKRGYIVKSLDPDDKRATRLSLSEAGMALLERAPKPARGLLPQAVRQLDASQLSQLDAGLQALLNRMDAIDDGYALEPLPFNMAE
ncbi:MarR family winged helix-turn-helix transcriptional regulator [Herminiimonas sp. CN]|uniref:MarR family winged helix-turn-helix transcriptional regulator n=1 Tax=Herminiimonas sp. CN TaxID=1349818 RepID=UPI00047420D1|nr:MarR family transcriptional regulator [Herminiimonas sp. CN]